ncbi:MAG: ABC transporter substrate-binding protein, partial [Bacteroidia bacterium]|nr:ABC transporter substrate-binding protein [Bacteroidia bacterium]
MKNFLFILCACSLWFGSCRSEKEKIRQNANSGVTEIKYATGFQLTNQEDGSTLLEVTSPWPGADKTFRYLLVPRNSVLGSEVQHENVDAVIRVPVKKFIATSTTHIPALESLGALEGMVGFPGTQYVSSAKARAQIDSGRIRELGANEALNTEMTLALDPEVVFGFSISDQNSSYKFLNDAGIPVIYNGDWTEHSPLGKAEWIHFFAPFFGKEKEADSIFSVLQENYNEAKLLASRSKEKPSVMSGALYKDVWYLPGGDSWAAQFIE